MKVAILRDNNVEVSKKWELACQKQGIFFIVVNLLCDDWYYTLTKFSPDFCVVRPSGRISQNKYAFDNKIYFIEKYLSLKVFPGYDEIVIYENKATLSNFLQVNNIPHPKTFISFSLKEAIHFVENQKFPLVGKTLIGAAGSGVTILNNKSKAKKYISKVFSTGIKRRYGPNKKTGSLKKWFLKAISSPKYLIKKLKDYSARNNDIQKGVVFLQEFIPHDFEWRIVKIGKSYFGYKKLKIDGKASGSKEFGYGPVPHELLDFTKNICDRFKFNFMAIDIFFNDKEIYVNEMQTIFGHKNTYICNVDGKIGRYINNNNQWHFEEGDFNQNESYDLRLKTAIELYNNSNQ